MMERDYFFELECKQKWNDYEKDNEYIFPPYYQVPIKEEKVYIRSQTEIKREKLENLKRKHDAKKEEMLEYKRNREILISEDRNLEEYIKKERKLHIENLKEESFKMWKRMKYETSPEDVTYYTGKILAYKREIKRCEKKYEEIEFVCSMRDKQRDFELISLTRQYKELLAKQTEEYREELSKEEF